ncbi:MAG TPA: ATP-dependent DNA helicase RecG [Nitrolancea sp.]|nr:ATP-dependent DNA helicase RecG [Nitrolancea sp.]
MNRLRGDRTEEQTSLWKKMFALESRKGFRDTSVSGGFERFFAGLHARENPANGAGTDFLAELAQIFEGYARLEIDERERRINHALAILHPPSIQPGATDATRPISVAPRKLAPAPKTVSRKTPAATRLTSLDDSVTVLRSVGEGRARQLAALEVRTIRDLLFLLPRQHKDYSRLQPITSILFHRECTIRGEVVSLQEERTKTGKPVVEIEISDGTGRVRATWFNPYIARQLPLGSQVAISGRVEQQRGILCFRNPEWELLDDEMLHTGRLVPVYPLTKGLYQKPLRNLTRMALDAAAPLLLDPLDTAIRTRHRLMTLPAALQAIHYPDSLEQLQAARNRLAFDEFLVLQLGMVQRKVEWQAAEGHAFRIDPPQLSALHRALPFQFTQAQRRALDEILWDMALPRPMSRMLQGDVGSGKTVVAASAALVAIADGFQAALLAPTEILAEQHFRSLSDTFERLPEAERPALALLTGKSKAAERREIDERLAAGDIDLMVGTHALLEHHVEFKRLGLAIIDEQHRFGVGQRSSLRDKGYNPDVLVMTATPIPRSLSLVIHGDLDVSIIDELPPGRQAIETRRAESSQRRQVYQFLREQIGEGHQVFIIYPLVEESEAIDARAATVEYERLSADIFPDLRLGLLHGRMRSAEKDAMMTAFREREIDILVSTSVVEVGIDIPNATVMLIEGAERFGLSQLHQFRGRVGRGAARSYCILISGESSENGNLRLDALVQTQDGFRLSEIDLELRGPGEFFGKRQSGLPDLKLASLGDLGTLQQARDEAHLILADDPHLSAARNRMLREQVERFWAGGAGDLS